jgi:hypothetical protein
MGLNASNLAHCSSNIEHCLAAENRANKARLHHSLLVEMETADVLLGSEEQLKRCLTSA